MEQSNKKLLPTTFQSSQPTPRVKRVENNQIQSFEENQHFSMKSEWILLVCSDCRHFLLLQEKT